MMRKTKGANRFGIWGKMVIVKIALLQIGLFLAAWSDLNRRSPDQIVGSKLKWRAALFLDLIGPLLYFRKGRRLSTWNEDDVPEQQGRVALVTGANSGIGFETARVLSQRGATVIMACRNLQKAEEAAATIRRLAPHAELVVMHLDLADLASVEVFANQFCARYDRLDLLINNAGLMIPPFDTTAQGFESQFGVNHLGHFALTARLLDRLTASPGARIVSVSSNAHRFGEIDFDDLNWQKKSYSAMGAYGQSKLANLLFTYELQRRVAAAGHDVMAVAAHPGWTATNLQRHTTFMERVSAVIGQPQPMGALPTLYAATAPDVEGGEYFGPTGFAEIRGNPERVQSNARSHDLEVAAQLWTVSEELTGVAFPMEQRTGQFQQSR